MSFIEKNWMLILVIFLSGAMLLWPLVQRRFSPMKEVGTLNVTQLINHQNAVLLDVREAERVHGRASCRTRCTFRCRSWTRRAGELAKLTSRPVIVYCERGQRSRAAGAILAKLGFADIYPDRRLKAWKDAGLPLERSDPGRSGQDGRVNDGAEPKAIGAR